MLEDLALPLLIAALATPLVLLVGYYRVVPFMLNRGYRGSLSATQFTTVDGSEGAGSVDLKYYTLYFDVRKNDIIIHGEAPNALHWQFGAFDGMARLIDGAYLNHKTVALDESGRFSITVTSSPHGKRACDESLFDEGVSNVLDCSSASAGMIIFRVVLPQQDVALPSVSTTV